MSDRLYDLLPAIHRIRDAEHGLPLRALLGILAEQIEVVDRDIAGLYDDWFVETAEEWVVPYIGDLLGARLLHTVESSGVFSQRAFVANTLRYRRRKGTLAMLEDLARDVTGWGSHAVAAFELLGWTQQLNHLRSTPAPASYPRSPDRLEPRSVHRVGTVNLRALDVMDRIGGAFDECTHTVDVRRPRQEQGWYDVRTLIFHLWRLQSYPIRFARAEPSAAFADGFHFSQLGHPMPLFTNPEGKADEQGALSTEQNVPGPIRPVAFFEHPERYYGASSDGSLAVHLGVDLPPDDLELVPVGSIICKDLSDWAPPPAGRVAVDVRLGRLAFAPGEAPAAGVTVSYHLGFGADVGGGPYDRRATLERAGPLDFEAVVARVQPPPPPLPALPPLWRQSVAAALAAWDPAAQPRAVITVADDGTYDEELTVALAGRQHLVVQAGDRNRPTLRLRDAGGAPGVLALTGGAGEDATLTLAGLLVEGAIRIDATSLGRLELRHCTLVPGLALDEDGRPVLPAAPSIEAAAGTEAAPANAELEVEIDHCIVGALRLPGIMGALTVRDSIVDRPEEGGAPPPRRLALAQSDDAPGPPTTLVRSTVFGEVVVRSLDASETVFTQRVEVRRRQVGCVRYCYVDDAASITPRRFRCQPELAVETRRRRLGLDALPLGEQRRIRGRIRPDFTSTHFGDPGYAQLHHATAPEIRTGAESGAEMGAFEHLKQPQREENLRIRLDEYMPYGMEAGLVFVT